MDARAVVEIEMKLASVLTGSGGTELVPARIPHAELRYGFLGRKSASSLPSVNRGPGDNVHGMFDVPPGETRTMSFDVWVFPPVLGPKEAFTARSIGFIDQFGNYRPHDSHPFAKAKLSM